MLTGPLLLVLGLSGAVLVLRPELEPLLAGSPPVAAAVAPPSVDAVVRSALLVHPRGEARAVRVPVDRHRAYRVEVHRGEERIDVEIDPSTLRVVSSRAPERSAFAAVHALHGAFHAGRAGAGLVGLLGVWLVVESLTGLWLYGPSVRPRTAAGARGQSRVLHRCVGAVSLAAGVVLGLTGALLALVTALSGGPRAPSPSPGGLERLDAVVARVETAAPGARVVAIVAETGGIARVDVRAAATGEARSIRVARATGDIAAAGAAPTTVRDVVRRLHAGDFAGSALRVAYAAIGCALPVLAITGFAISARRLRARRS